MKHGGALLLLSLPLLALMGPTGGYPTKPNFQTVTVTGAVNAGPITIAASKAIAGQAALFVTGNATSGQSVGAYIRGGTNSSDYGFAVGNQSGSITGLEVYGDGHTVLGQGITTGTSCILAISSSCYGWGLATQVAIDIGPGGAIRGDSNKNIAIDQNIYYDGANYRYKNAGTGVELAMVTNGSYSYLTANYFPSGAAGAVATPVSATIPKTAAIAAGGSGCTTNTNFAFSACTRNSVGNYTFTFNAGLFNAAPVCTTGINTTSNSSVVIQGVSATSVNAVNLASGTPTDSLVYVVCVGT